MTSYEYSKPMQYEVFCHRCGHKYLEQDPGVDFIYSGHVWQCADESACAERVALAALNAELEGLTGE